MNTEAVNVKVSYGVERATLSWEATSTTNLLGWLVEQHTSAGWSKLGEIGPESRGLTVKPLAPGSVGFRVWAVVKQYAKEVKGTVPGGEPAPEPKPESKPEPSGSMIVALDTGGWPAAFYADMAQAIKHLRVKSSELSSGAAEAKKVGLDYSSVIFGTGGTIGSIDPAKYSQEVVAACKAYPIRAIEVLNEPGGSWFWSDPTNYSAYFRLLKATHEAIAAAGLQVKVLASWDGGHAEPLPQSVTFGRGWKTLGGLAYCDGVTVHPYGGGKGECGGALGDRKKIEAAHEESGKPVYITEVGFPTAVGQPATGDSQQWTEAQQGQNFQGLIEWCKAQGYVANLTAFNYRDYGTNDFYGVETHAGARKPVFAVLKAS